MQKDFVFVQTDKAGNNISIVCKNFTSSNPWKNLEFIMITWMKKKGVPMWKLRWTQNPLSIATNDTWNPNLTPQYLKSFPFFIGFLRCIRNLTANKDILLLLMTARQRIFLLFWQNVWNLLRNSTDFGAVNTKKIMEPIPCGFSILQKMYTHRLLPLITRLMQEMFGLTISQLSIRLSHTLNFVKNFDGWSWKRLQALNIPL